MPGVHSDCQVYCRIDRGSSRHVFVQAYRPTPDCADVFLAVPGLLAGLF